MTLRSRWQYFLHGPAPVTVDHGPPVEGDDPWATAQENAERNERAATAAKQRFAQQGWAVAQPGRYARKLDDFESRAFAALAEAGDVQAAVSADDLGIDIAALAQRTRNATAPDADTALAIAASANIAGELPLFYGNVAEQQMDESGRVVQNWTMPVPLAPGMPILEQVTNRIQRSVASLKAYLEDAVVGPAIDILAEFPLSRGFTIDALYNSEEFPTWFDPDWVNPDSLVDANGDSKVGTAVSAWVANQCQLLSDRLRLTYQLTELQKEAYIHGDGFIYRVDQVQTPPDDPSRCYPENDIADIQGLNPTAVWVAKDAVGRVAKIVLVGQPGVRATDLPLDQTIHIKHRGNAWSTYGMPQTMRVFEEVEVKQAYLKAAKAWGTRYALPIKMLQYGLLVRAGQNSVPAANPAMRDEALAAIEAYDDKKGQILVGPFHWKFTLVGADGAQMVSVSNEIAEANKRILAGLGVPAAFLFGDWANYATARIQYSGLMHRLKGVQESLQWVAEQRIFLPFCQMRGYIDNTGAPIAIRVRWRRAHLEDDASYMQLMAAIAAIPDQEILSNQTLREAMGFANEVEVQRFAEQQDAARQKQLDQIKFMKKHPQLIQSQSPLGAPAQHQPDQSPAGPREGGSNDTNNEDGKGAPDMLDAQKPKTKQPSKQQVKKKAQKGQQKAKKAQAALLSDAQTQLALGADASTQRVLALRIKQQRALQQAYAALLERLADAEDEAA